MPRFSPFLLGVLALAAMTDTPPAPATGTTGPDGSGHAHTLDALPPTRAQASADFRRTPGGRAKSRWKRTRRGGG